MLKRLEFSFVAFAVAEIALYKIFFCARLIPRLAGYTCGAVAIAFHDGEHCSKDRSYEA